MRKIGGCIIHRSLQSPCSAVIKNPLCEFLSALSLCKNMLYNIFSFFSQIFGGVGIACLPLGLIFSFIRRPKAVITRSQYIKVGSSLHTM